MTRTMRMMTLAAVIASSVATGGADAQPCAGAARTVEGDPGATDEARDPIDDPIDHPIDDAVAPAVRLPVRAPAVADVIAAANAAAGLDRDPSRGWTRRARLSGLVPWVAVRTGRNTRWQTTDPEVDQGVALEVRATWRLDRLVFDGRELQAASFAAARRRERRRLAREVVRRYFAWRRAAERGAWSRRDEAAAELDALTDGWFSEAVARPQTRRVAKPRRRR